MSAPGLSLFSYAIILNLIWMETTAIWTHYTSLLRGKYCGAQNAPAAGQSAFHAPRIAAQECEKTSALSRKSI
jgi:hypothetical protein